MIDTASILADRYKDNRGQLTAALMGQPVPDQQLDAYSALRAMQLLKESDRMAMAQQARGPSGEQPSLAEAAVTPDQSMGLAGMAGQPVMAQAQQPQQAPPVMQGASGGLASMPTSDDDYHEGGMVAFATGGRPSSTDYMKQAMENIPQPTSLAEREAGMSAQRDYVNTLYAPDRMAPFLEDIAKERRELSGNKDRNLGYSLLAAAKAVVDKPSTGKGLGAIVPGLAAAGAAFGSEMQKFEKEERDANRALRQSEMTLAAAQQARDDGKTKEAISLFDKYDTQRRDAEKMKADVNIKAADIEAGREKAELTAQVAREGHAVQREGFNKPDQVERELAIQEKNLGRPFTTRERVAARAELYEGQYGARYTGLGGGNKDDKITGDFQKDLEKRIGILTLRRQMQGKSPTDVEGIDREIAEIRSNLIEEYKATKTELTGKPAGGAPAVQQAAGPQRLSQEQYNAAPSKTVFIAPDGSIRTKP